MEGTQELVPRAELSRLSNGGRWEQKWFWIWGLQYFLWPLHEAGKTWGSLRLNELKDAGNVAQVGTLGPPFLLSPPQIPLGLARGLADCE